MAAAEGAVPSGGAEPRALVGEVSGAGLAGRGRRRGRCRALELLARKRSRAAGAELEEAAAGWQRFRGRRLGSGTAGGSELGRGLIGLCRARGCRCSLAQQEEGAGRWEVGGGSGSGCVLGGEAVRARAAAAALFLSPAATSPLQNRAGKRARPPFVLCRWHLPPSGPRGSLLGQRPRVLPAPSAAPVSLVLFRAGCARRRRHSSRELQANSGFRHLSVTVHFPEVPPVARLQFFRSPSAKESALTPPSR